MNNKEKQQEQEKDKEKQQEQEKDKEKQQEQEKDKEKQQEQEKEQEIENQQEQELTNDDKTDFDILSIDHGTDEEKKNNIGEYIYEYIEQDHQELAGKITGMIRELDLSELQQIVQSKQLLNQNVAQAIKVLNMNKDQNNENKQVYITNIPNDIDEQELKEFAQQFGEVKNFQFQIQAEGRSRIAQVEYMNSESALEAFNSSPDRRIFGGAIL
ncbi:MAG: hypothetical protein EZS28_016648, partial [Streblomastix strix]